MTTKGFVLHADPNENHEQIYVLGAWRNISPSNLMTKVVRYKVDENGNIIVTNGKPQTEEITDYIKSIDISIVTRKRRTLGEDKHDN